MRWDPDVADPIVIGSGCERDMNLVRSHNF